ncbi:hypothetical protein ABZ946_04850 [Streptomyces sp. NPDC046324]|uniref:hypothetical protein n=1 Tax=Streptomyces sp. NPDC046324 TaxID=3154915 RepID=UPI0033DFC5B5
MGKTIDDVASDIEGLRKALLESNVPVKVQYQGDYASKDKKKQEPEPVDSMVSALKKALTEGQPKLVTDAMLPFDFVGRFNEMHQELKKELSTELWEAAGFDTIGAAVEKVHEGNKDAWRYWVAALSSLLVPAILAGIGLVLLTRFTAIQQGFQAWFFNLFKGLTGKQDHIWAKNANGDGWGFQPKDEVQKRANPTATAIADIPPDAIRALREQLEKINPELLKFNNRAPSFIREFRKLPSESKAKKAAEAIKKIADAVTGVDHSRLQPVAEGVNKINNAMRNADPRKVTKVAKATEKLKTAMVGFDATKLPKSTDLGAAATKMSDLAQATGTLRTKMQEFARTVQSLDQVIGAATG